MASEPPSHLQNPRSRPPQKPSTKKPNPANPSHQPPRPTPTPTASNPTSPITPTPEPQSAQNTPNDEKQHPQQQSEESFESYYLKQVTAEFADDIDKIRNASDFNERSVSVLIHALRQSGANFTEEERGRVMGARG